MSHLFRTIVADPPWAIKFGSDTRRHKRTGGGDKGTWRSEAAMDYPTMTVDELCGLRVPAEKDAHCYIWTINAYVEATYRVARAWGFRPVVLLTWGKTPRGIGFGGAFVQTTEHILFCRRGRDICKKRVDSTWWNWPRPEKGTGPKHSRKPEAFQNLVESVSPGPYLEMFARRQRPGWSVWGNQVASEMNNEVDMWDQKNGSDGTVSNAIRRYTAQWGLPPFVDSEVGGGGAEPDGESTATEREPTAANALPIVSPVEFGTEPPIGAESAIGAPRQSEP